jgi:hypothetical protein
MEDKMKKHKTHILSIIIIIVLLFFALGTSRPAYGELTVINKTEKTLKFKFVRRERSIEFTEEFTLEADQNIKLKVFNGGNVLPKYLGIYNLTIYNEDNEIIKEYREINYEKIPGLDFHLDKEKNRRYYYYSFIINDEFLE